MKLCLGDTSWIWLISLPLPQYCVAAWCQSANSPNPAALISRGRLLARHPPGSAVYFFSLPPFFFPPTTLSLISVSNTIFTIAKYKRSEGQKYRNKQLAPQVHEQSRRQSKVKLICCYCLWTHQQKVIHQHCEKSSLIFHSLSFSLRSPLTHPPLSSTCPTAKISPPKPWDVGIPLQNLCNALSVPHTLTSSI